MSVAHEMVTVGHSFFPQKKICVVIKHQNPCGMGVAETSLEAWKFALEGDPEAAFGGVVACNFTPDETVLQEWKSRFLEVIVAPEWPPSSLSLFQSKPNVRLIGWPLISSSVPQMRSFSDGVLVQSKDSFEHEEDWEVVTVQKPQDAQKEAARLAWFVSRFVKSNAIVLALSHRVVAIGAGQMSRIDSMRIVQRKLQEKGDSLDRSGMALASDAFFPFADSITIAKEMGISCVIQPMGSMRDSEVLKECEKCAISMIATHRRHFYH